MQGWNGLSLHYNLFVNYYRCHNLLNKGEAIFFGGMLITKTISIYFLSSYTIASELNVLWNLVALKLVIKNYNYDLLICVAHLSNALAASRHSYTQPYVYFPTFEFSKLTGSETWLAISYSFKGMKSPVIIWS